MITLYRHRCLNSNERLREDEIHRSLDTSSYLYFSSHLGDDVQKCATVDHMSDISSINKFYFRKKDTSSSSSFLPFIFIDHDNDIQRLMLDWQTISMLLLLRYLNGVIESLVDFVLNTYIHIHICVLLKSSIKRKARVEYVDTLITSSLSSSIESLSWTNA